MEKIPTIFERNWEGNRKVKNIFIQNLSSEKLKTMTATEKLDGTNVRVTVRNHTCVRLEKRKNPTKEQKVEGIKNPWYVDAIESDQQDKHIFSALKNTDLSSVPDGEWSGEALGENIQGNPLNLTGNTIVFFSLGHTPVLDAPTTFEELKEWLPQQESVYSKNGCKIEGIVWHGENGEMFKIKARDFDK